MFTGRINMEKKINKESKAKEAAQLMQVFFSLVWLKQSGWGLVQGTGAAGFRVAVNAEQWDM